MDDGYKKDAPHFFYEGHESFAHADIQAPPTLLPKLMHRLKDAQHGVQGYNDIASLLVALDDQNDAVRTMAIRELAQWHGSISDIPTERLLAALNDSSWLVREAAILMLDALHIEVSPEHQMMALLDENEFVREAARLVFAATDSTTASRSEVSRATARVAPAIRRDGRSRFYHALQFIDSLFIALYLTNRKGLLMAGHSPSDKSDMTYLEQITLQQRKRRRTTLGITGAIVAFLVIVGIAFSWFTVLQKMPHTATGRVGNTLDKPILSDTDELQQPQLNWVDNTHLVLSDPYSEAYATIWNVETKASQQMGLFNLIAAQQFQGGGADWASNGKYVVNRAVNPDTPPTTTSSPTSFTVTVEVWNVLTAQKLVTVSYHEKEVVTQQSVDPNGIPYPPNTALSPDNTRLAIGQSDSNVTIWSLSTGKQVAFYHIDSFPVSSVQWSTDSSRLLVQSSRGLAQLWDTMTGKKLSSFLPPLTQEIQYTPSGSKRSTIPSPLTLSPNGKLMVGVVGTNTIEVWDAITTKVLYTHKQAANDALSADWLSDKRIFIPASNEAQIWNLDTNQIILNVPIPSQQASFAFSPSQKYFSLADASSQNATIWDTSIGQQVVTIHNGANLSVYGVAQSLIWSRDERYVVTISKDRGKSLNNVVQVWNATTGKLIVQYHSHGTQVLQVTWSPDGKYLASVSDGDLGNVMEVWRAPS